MGTSGSSGEILYDHADLGADRFVDTALMRDCLDTALHKADQAGQVRLQWCGTIKGDVYSTIYGDDDTSGALREGTADDPVWYFFPLRGVYVPKLRADGSGYPLRVRVGGCASGAGTVDFGIAVLPGRASTGWLYSGGSPTYRKTFMGVTSTTAAWLTPDDGSNLLQVPSSLVEEGYRLETLQATKVDIGGADTVVTIPTLQVVVFGQSRTAGVVPRLWAAHASEYVGQT